MSRSGHSVDEFRVEAVSRFLDSMYAVYKKTGTIRQDYASEFDGKVLASKSDYVLSGLGPTELLIEDVLGIQPDALNKRIEWRLHRTDRHGIENLHLGDITLSLVAARRDNPNSPVELTVSADKPFELRVCMSGTTNVLQVPAGKHSYTVDGH